jgi:hypothetical protein
MRIISFSSAAGPSFWALPVQALGPWMSRIRHSLEQVAPLPAAQRDADARTQTVACVARAASNDAVFAVPEASVRPGHTACRAAPQGLRVVRESDSAIGAECAGRMVISGRMADVCAELDRMALRVAAVQEAYDQAMTPHVRHPARLAPVRHHRHRRRCIHATQPFTERIPGI